MKIVRKVIKLGNSKAITLPKEIARAVKIRDTIIVDIELDKILTSEVREFQCVCGARFTDVEDTAMKCPECGSNKILSVEEEEDGEQ